MQNSTVPDGNLPLIISFFSHKGGVGKTTCLHNIAYILGEVFKLKLLVVDMDTQASLTGLIMHKEFVALGKEKFNSLPPQEKKPFRGNKNLAKLGEREFLNYTGEERRTSFELFKGKTDSVYKLNLAWVKDNIDAVVQQVKPNTINKGTDREFFFIAGDRRISTIDEELAEAFAIIKADTSFGAYYHFMPGLITCVLRQVAKQHAADLILIDFGPSPTPLNRSAVMGSDYFVINCLADFLSRWSIESLADYINKWQEDKPAQVLRSNTLANTRLPSCPKFLGCVISRVKMYANDITSDKKTMVDLIKAEVKHCLDKFKHEDAKYLENFTLLREFTRLSDKVEETGTPICQIRPEDIPKGQRNGNISDEDIKKGQMLYLNSYFSAVVGLMANLSEKHHQALGNIFRLDVEDIFPKKDLKITDNTPQDADKNQLVREKSTKSAVNMPFGSKDDRKKVFKSIEETMILKPEEALTTYDLCNDIYCAFSQEEQKTEKHHTLESFAKLKREFEEKTKACSEIMDEMKASKSSFFAQIKKKKPLTEDPQLHNLCYRISPELDRTSKKARRARNANENSAHDETPEEFKKDEKLAEKYLNTYRETRETASKMIKLLRQKDTVRAFLDIAKRNSDAQVLGEGFYSAYAKVHKLKNKKLLVPDDASQATVKVYKTFDLNDNPMENDLILCETDNYKKQFSMLKSRAPKATKKKPTTPTIPTPPSADETNTDRKNRYNKRENHRVNATSLTPKKGKKGKR